MLLDRGTHSQHTSHRKGKIPPACLENARLARVVHVSLSPLPYAVLTNLLGHHLCRMTERWEASLWLKGRQVYLGGFSSEEEAARMYDLAALGCKGPTADTNFPAGNYTEQVSGDLATLSPVCASSSSWC